MITLASVSKRFEDVDAIRQVSLSIPSGQTTVLLGPSGCGKSTLLRLMIGIIKPDSGTLRIAQQELTSHSLPTIRHETGYMVQDGGLFPHLTARENVSLVARYLRWPSTRIDSRIAELADLVKLHQGVLERFPSQISGGQRQRTSLMRALMLDPRVLLLDEPLGALDPMIRYELQTDLRTIFRSLKKTVVLVTHDLFEASYLGDHIVLLKDGEIIQKGTLQELSDCPSDPFVTQFIQAQQAPLK